MIAVALALHLAAAQVPPVNLRDAAASTAARSSVVTSQTSAPPFDAHANSVGSLEVFTASAGALAGSVTALGLGLASVGLVSATTNPRGDVISGALVAGVLASVVTQQILTPLFAALGARLASDGPRQGSLNKALGYAFLAQGSGAVVLLISGALASATNSNALSVLAVGLYLLNELVAVPMAASYGLHQGDAVALPARRLAPAPPPAVAPPDAPPPMYLPPGAPPTPPPATVGFLFHF